MSTMASHSHTIRSILKKEWELVHLSLSFSFIMCMYILMGFVTTAFAGHVGPSYLTGVGLAITCYRIIVTSVSTGYTSVMSTYGPQVYGSSNPGELGTMLLKCLLQGIFTHLIIIGPFLNLVYVIDQLPDSGFYPADISSSNHSGSELGNRNFKDIAVDYMRIVVPVEFLDYSVTMISTYFAIQDENKFVYLVSLVMIVSHVLYNYVLVNISHLHVVGLGTAAILGRLTPLAVSLTVCFIMVKRGRFAWNGFTVRAFLGWKPMLKLGGMGALYAFADLALLDISTFLSRYDGTDAMSVVIIIFQILGVTWSIAFGMSQASATVIGAALSEGDAGKTRLFMKLSIFNAAAVSTVIAIIGYSLQTYEVLIFSTVDGVTTLFKKTFWIFCIGMPFDHIQTTLNRGILAAFGTQQFSAWSMSIASYVIGLPIIIVTIFLSDLKVAGILIGTDIVYVIMFVAASVRVWMVDIDKEIEKSKKRVFENEKYMNMKKDEIHEIQAPTTSYDAIEGIRPEDHYVEADIIAAHEVNKADNTSDCAESSPILGPEQNGDSHDVYRERNKVLLALATATVACILLTGISLLRK